MQNTMTVREARDNFSDLLGAVFYGKKSISIEKKGRVFAVVVNPDDYTSFKNAAKRDFFRTVRNIQNRNKNKNILKQMKDIAIVAEDVRAKNYEER